MKKILFVFSFIFAFSFVFSESQETKKDAEKNYYSAGLDYFEKEEYKKAYESFFRAINGGDARGNYYLGWLLHHGKGVNQDYKKASLYYKKAVLLNDYRAYENLSELYLNGKGVEQDFYKALDCTKNACEIIKSETGEYDEKIASKYDLIASIYAKLEDYETALTFYNKSLNITKKIAGEKNLTVFNSYQNIGYVYIFQNKYEDAVSMHIKALELLEELPERELDNLAEVYGELANVYYLKKDYDNALDYYERANEIWMIDEGMNGDKLSESYSTLAKIYFNEGDYDSSINYFNMELELLKSLYPSEENSSTSDLYNYLGRIYFEKEEYNSALVNFQKALDIRISVYGQNSSFVADSYMNLACYYVYVEKNVMASAEYFLKALEVYENLKDYKKVAQISWNLYTCFDAFGEIPKKQISMFESFKREVFLKGLSCVEKEENDKFVALPYFYAAIDYYVENENREKAFYYAELIKNRRFINEYGSSTASGIPGITDEERKNIEQYNLSIKQYEKSISAENSKPYESRNGALIATTNSKLVETRRNLELLEKDISRRFPKYNKAKKPSVCNPNTAKKWCGPFKAAFEYVLYHQSYEEYINAKTPVENLDVRKLLKPDYTKYPISSWCMLVTSNDIIPVKINGDYDYLTKVVNLRNYLVYRYDYSSPEMSDVCSELYEMLVTPVLAVNKMPESVKNICIVPDGPLSFVPFDILGNEDKVVLGENYRISMSPALSFSVMQSMVKLKTPSKLVAFGNPIYSILKKGQNRGIVTYTLSKPGKNYTGLTFEKLASLEDAASYYAANGIYWDNLAFSSLELKNLREKLFTGNNMISLEGINASEENLKKMSESGELAQYPFIHLSCHAFFDNNYPRMSSCVFSDSTKEISLNSEDGYLTLQEASLLEMNADFLNLTGCTTSLAEITCAEGMTSYVRALMLGGARRIGVTMWSIDDEALCEFVLNIYKKIVVEHSSIEEAYSETKKEFQKSKKWSTPYYWAGFTLFE